MSNVVAGHKVRWFVYVGSGETRERIPFQSTMRGQWDFDAVCECGWDSKTGGAVRSYVRREVEFHKWLAKTTNPKGAKMQTMTDAKARYAEQAAKYRALAEQAEPGSRDARAYAKMADRAEQSAKTGTDCGFMPSADGAVHVGYGHHFHYGNGECDTEPPYSMGGPA